MYVCMHVYACMYQCPLDVCYRSIDFRHFLDHRLVERSGGKTSSTNLTHHGQASRVLFGWVIITTPEMLDGNIQDPAIYRYHIFQLKHQMHQ